VSEGEQFHVAIEPGAEPIVIVAAHSRMNLGSQIGDEATP